MLMTMEEASKRESEIFPNPERLDKVENSMNNLESIVRERNRAYHMLETGETGERPGKLVYNRLGKIYTIYITSIIRYTYIRIKDLFLEIWQVIGNNISIFFISF